MWSQGSLAEIVHTFGLSSRMRVRGYLQRRKGTRQTRQGAPWGRSVEGQRGENLIPRSLVLRHLYFSWPSIK